MRKINFLFYQCRVGAWRDSEQTDQWEKFVGTFNSLDYDNGRREYQEKFRREYERLEYDGRGPRTGLDYEGWEYER
jgi:hypothetical protein